LRRRGTDMWTRREWSLSGEKGSRLSLR